MAVMNPRQAMARSPRRWVRWLLTATACAAAGWFVITFVYFPNLSIIRSSVFPDSGSGLDTVRRLVDSPVVRTALINTIVMTVASVVTVSVIGVLQTLFLEALDLRWRPFLTVCYAIPLVFGSISAVTGYTMVYGPHGLLTAGLRALFPALPPTWFSGAVAVLFVHTFTMTGYHFLFLRPAIRRVDFSIVEAARSLGMSPLRALIRVVMPILKPTLLASTLMVVIASLGSFAAPSILGGSSFTMIAPLIQSLTGLGRSDMAALTGLLLGITTAGALAWVLHSQHRASLSAGGRGTRPFQRIHVASPVLRGLAQTIAVVIAMINLAPLAVTLLMSLSTPRAIRNSTLSLPTVVNYQQVLSSGTTLRPLMNSLVLCLIAIPLALAISVFLTHLLHHHPGWISSLVDMSLLLPYFLPGVLLGLGFLLAFASPTPLLAGHVLVGSYWILPAAYTVALLPTAVRFLRAHYASMDPALDEAAQTLGAHAPRRFLRVSLPQLAPVLLQITALSFNQTFDEYTISVMLYNVNDTPFGVALGTLARSQDLDLVGQTTAYVIISTAIALLVITLADRLAAMAAPGFSRTREAAQ